MLSRRRFASSLVAALGACADPKILLHAQSLPPAHAQDAAISFSVMMWTLKKLGTFEENLERVAQAGYGHIELVGEQAKWSEEDHRRILAKMRTLNLSVDAMTGVKSAFADPSAGDAFIADLKAFLPMAKRLECRQLIVVSGKRLEGVSGEQQHAACIETLKRAADVLAPTDMVVVIEPIDRIENPPIYLDGVTEAFEITRAVGSPHIKVLYDLYHEQRTHGNLIEKLQANIAEVGLIHIADVPGRHQPGTGEVNYGNIYRQLAQLQYRGVVAMEFYPTGDVVEVLRRAREDAQRSMA